MLNKKKFFLASGVIFLLGIFWNSQIVFAAEDCCVISPGGISSCTNERVESCAGTRVDCAATYGCPGYIPSGGYIPLNANCCVIINGAGNVECRSGNPGDCAAAGGSFNQISCSSISTCPRDASLNTASTTVTFENPLGATTTISQLLSAIMNSLMGIIGFVAVIFIILGGIMYMMSGGNEQMVTRAKKTWTGAVIGLAIALAAPTFLKEIQNILSGGAGGQSIDQWVASGLTLKDIAIRVLNLLLSLLGIFATIALIIGGGMYLTAYGDEKKIDTGKSILTYAIIGIVVSFAALVIVRQVGNLLGARLG